MERQDETGEAAGEAAAVMAVETPELIDVFASASEDEMARAREALDDLDRRYRNRKTGRENDWVAVRLMYARGAEVRDIEASFGMPKKTVTDRIKRDKWLQGVEGGLRAMARDAYLYALAWGERDGMPDGGEAAVRAGLDWRPIRRGGTSTAPPQRVTAERWPAGSGGDPVQVWSGGEYRGDGSGSEPGACEQCSAREEALHVHGLMDKLVTRLENEAARDGHPEAAAFMRCLRLGTRGLASSPLEHLDADGKLREWVGDGYPVSGYLCGSDTPEEPWPQNALRADNGRAGSSGR